MVILLNNLLYIEPIYFSKDSKKHCGDDTQIPQML